MEKMVDALVRGEEPVRLVTSCNTITKNLGIVGTKVVKKTMQAVMNKLNYFEDYTTRPFGYRSVHSNVSTTSGCFRFSDPATATTSSDYAGDLPMDGLLPQ